MNAAFLEIIGASDDDRRALFLSTARRLGTAVQYVEKDFWTCWILDALYNGLPPDQPRLLFKGGTSLSKTYALISRFSEDIDVTVFRDDLGQHASITELEALSGKKRQARLEAIKASCQKHVNGPLRDTLGFVIEETMRAADVTPDRARLTLDESDVDQQTLLFWYPNITTESDGYVRSAIKIESGAKSALDPHESRTVTPYVADEIRSLDLRVSNVTTVHPERTFWDKVAILHGLRRWFDRRAVLRHGGQRVSRHYYDVSQIADSDIGTRAIGDHELARDCARHARMFFYSADRDLDHAVPGMFALMPSPAMQEALRRDYDAMAGMIFGSVPLFDDVMAAIARLERAVNSAAPADSAASRA